MRLILNRLTPLAVGMVIALVVGCTTVKETEDMLVAAGFKMVPAATAEQQAHLKTLPHKLAAVQRQAKTYYVFPDVKRNMLYVGQQAQYEQYQKLYRQAMQAALDRSAAVMNNDAWATWGTWEGLP
jgi:hypothetical protein